jgi:hypothetical protein
VRSIVGIEVYSSTSPHLSCPALRHLLVLRTLFRAVAHKPSLSPVLRVTFRYSGSQALAVGRPQGGGIPLQNHLVILADVGR